MLAAMALCARPDLVHQPFLGREVVLRVAHQFLEGRHEVLQICAAPQGVLQAVDEAQQVAVLAIDHLDSDFVTRAPAHGSKRRSLLASRRAAQAGILSAWVGSLLVMLVTALAAVPLGVAAGLYLEEYAKRNWLTKIAALIAISVLNNFKERFDHRRYNGAILLGLKGISVKSHGSADAFSFGFAIGRAYDAAENRVVERIAGRMARPMVPDAATAGETD
mgnify:CR=1 FL=1